MIKIDANVQTNAKITPPRMLNIVNVRNFDIRTQYKRKNDVCENGRDVSLRTIKLQSKNQEKAGLTSHRLTTPSPTP